MDLEKSAEKPSVEQQKKSRMLQDFVQRFPANLANPANDGEILDALWRIHIHRDRGIWVVVGRIPCGSVHD